MDGLLTKDHNLRWPFKKEEITLGCHGLNLEVGGGPVLGQTACQAGPAPVGRYDVTTKDNGLNTHVLHSRGA